MEKKNRREWQFARLTGKGPKFAPTRFELKLEVEEVVETFGPPEIVGPLFSWTFARADGKRGFSLVAHVPKNIRNPNIDLQGSALTGGICFYKWAVGRLGSVSNGDEPPLFVGSANSFVQAVNQAMRPFGAAAGFCKSDVGGEAHGKRSDSKDGDAHTKGAA